jgi:hypothetical protein
MLTAAFAVAALTTTTTTQIQPAYSQATHCSSSGFGTEVCVTPGQNPSCSGPGCVSSNPTHPQAGQQIGDGHRDCGQGSAVCSVTRGIPYLP